LTTILEAARKYRGWGFNVIPLAYKTKEPPAGFDLDKHFETMLPDSELEKYFGNGALYNVGIITGAISGIIVIDVDSDEVSRIFLDKVATIPSLNNKVSQTYMVKSSNGYHVYLKLAPGEFPEGIGTTQLYNGGKHKEICVKGNRGYVVTSPSLHPSGKIYESNDKELQSINAEEWKLLLGAFNTTEAYQTPIQELFKEDYKKSEGNNRHLDVLRVCDSLIAKLAGILSENQIWQMAYVWNQEHCTPPLEDKEFEKLWKQAAKWIAAHTPQEPRAGMHSDTETIGQAKASNKKERKKSDALTELVLGNCKELFLNQYDEGFVCIRVNDHVETLRLESADFRFWLANLYYSKHEESVSEEQIKESIMTLTGKARYEGKKRELFLRVYGDVSDAIYYDLCNDKWRCVKLTKDGWSIEQAPPFFQRFKNNKEQVMPAKKYRANVLDRFFALTNVKKEDRMLAAVQLHAAFIRGITHPVFEIHGDHGSAKTFTQKLFKSVIDPAVAMELSIPRDSNELIQQMSHNYVCLYKNVSELSQWVSDLFCTAVEGSGSMKRSLFTNADDYIFTFRPIVYLNGIEPVAQSADLLDRTVSFEFERIDKQNRKTEKKLFKEFNELLPELLGCIFDNLVRLLQRIPETEEEIPLERLADFHQIGRVLADILGYSKQQFDLKLAELADKHALQVIQNNQLAEILKTVTEEADQRILGPLRMKEILELLTEKAIKLRYSVDKKSGWPQTPESLRGKLLRLKTSLRIAGMQIEKTGQDKNKSNMYRVYFLSESDKPPQPPNLREKGHETGGKSPSEVPSEVDPNQKTTSDKTSDSQKILSHEQPVGSSEVSEVNPIHSENPILYCPEGCNKAFATQKQVDEHCDAFHAEAKKP